jgi:transposase
VQRRACRQGQTWARRTETAGREVHARLLDSPVLHADETGLRHEGKRGWVWMLRSPEASFFHVDRRRSATVFDALMPVGRFAGVMVTDFYGVYTRRADLLHAYCGAHLVRDAKKEAQVNHDAVALHFAATLSWLYRRGTEACARGEIDRVEEVRNEFTLLAQNERYAQKPALAKLQHRIQLRFEGVLAFLGRPDIPFHNNTAERDIRPIALHRKMTGGCRSPAGANALGHWMTVTQTLKKQDLPLVDWVDQAMQAHRQGTPVPSVFA